MFIPQSTQSFNQLCCSSKFPSDWQYLSCYGVFQKDSQKFLWKKDAFKQTVQSGIQYYPIAIAMKCSSLHLPLHSLGFFSVLPLSVFLLHVESYVSNYYYLQCSHIFLRQISFYFHIMPMFSGSYSSFIISLLWQFEFLRLTVLYEELVPSLRAFPECNDSERKYSQHPG